jgi:uncharacterized protein YkwD/transglutaminase-like putative cysteine protease
LLNPAARFQLALFETEPTMPIRFGCPVCQAVLEAADRKANTKTTCPKCGQKLRIPSRPAPTAPANKTVLAVDLSSPEKKPAPEPAVQKRAAPEPALQKKLLPKPTARSVQSKTPTMAAIALPTIAASDPRTNWVWAWGGFATATAALLALIVLAGAAWFLFIKPLTEKGHQDSPLVAEHSPGPPSKQASPERSTESTKKSDGKGKGTEQRPPQPELEPLSKDGVPSEPPAPPTLELPKKELPKKQPEQKSPPAIAREEFKAIDAHALGAPPEAEASLPGLASYLGQPCKSDMEKARAVYRWLTDRVVYDAEALFSGKLGDQSAPAVLQRRKGVCEGYANLFLDLCTRLQVKAVKVVGLAKGIGYGPGARRPNHAWNAFLAGENWFLVDATWGAGNLRGKDAVKRYSEVYFAAVPDYLALTHFPLESKWQMLESPRTLEQFDRLPQLRSTTVFFELAPPVELLREQLAPPGFKDFVLIYGFSGASTRLVAAPLGSRLEAGTDYTFHIRTGDFEDLVLLGKDGLLDHFVREGDDFRVKHKAQAGPLQVAGKAPGVFSYAGMLQYIVELKSSEPPKKQPDPKVEEKSDQPKKQPDQKDKEKSDPPKKEPDPKALDKSDPPKKQPGPKAEEKNAELREEIFKLTNAFREAEKRQPLKRNALLDAAAQKHAENMARQKKLTHDLDGKTPQDRAKAEGYERLTAENLVPVPASFADGMVAKAALESWKNSPVHRKSMLIKKADEIGIGVAVSDKGERYCCQLFGMGQDAFSYATWVNTTKDEITILLVEAKRRFTVAAEGSQRVGFPFDDEALAVEVMRKGSPKPLALKMEPGHRYVISDKDGKGEYQVEDAGEEKQEARLTPRDLSVLASALLLTKPRDYCGD